MMLSRNPGSITATALPITADARAARIAARQGGAIRRAQARECAVTDRMIGHRLRTGRWLRLHPGVYGISGTPPSWLGDVWAAALAVGPAVVVSHETALLLHGVTDRLLPRRPVTFTVPHGAHPRVAGAVVHQLDDLLTSHVVAHDTGLAVTTPARGVVDLAAVVGERRLGRVLDEAVAARLATLVQVATCLRDVARCGKRGVGRLGAALDERGPGHVPPHSELERALFAVLASGGLPPPRRQVTLPGRGAIDGVVDAAYPDTRIVIETDGRRWHTRIGDLARDHQRDAEAARAGWLTLRLMYEQVVGDPAGVCEVVRDVRRARRSIGSIGSAA